MKAFFQKNVTIFIVLTLIVFCGVTLSSCGAKKPANNDNQDKSEDTGNSDNGNTDTGDNNNDTGNGNTGDTTNPDQSDFASFSSQLQNIGSSDNSAEYTLNQIMDTAMTGYHRFEFVLESDQTSVPKTTAEYVASGNYIKITMDRVITDNAGIAHLSSRTINKEGVLKITHAVTGDNTKDVYQIGLSKAADFYLHANSGLTVILDVKYPGTVTPPADDSGDSGDSGAVSDPTTFSSSNQTLSNTNTKSDVRISNYQWSLGGGSLKFAWGVSSVSGNPIPPTSATYDSTAKTITVSFSGIKTDAVLGSDGILTATLADGVTSVNGSLSGSKHVYVFHLSKNMTYRIYRSTSPNQVIIEIKP